MIYAPPPNADKKNALLRHRHGLNNAVTRVGESRTVEGALAVALVSEQNVENNLESDVNTGPDIGKLIQKARTNAKRKSTVISHWAKYDAQTE